MRKLLIVLLGFACSCDNSVSESENKIEPEKIADTIKNVLIDVSLTDKELFVNFYQTFVGALVQGNDSLVNAHIHPKYGLNIIFNFSGSIPQLINYPKISYFDHDEPVRLSFKNLDSLALIPPKFESLPKVVCEQKFYEKEGCFAEATTNNIEAHPWNIDGVFEEVIKTIDFAVLNTHNFVFYCSKIDGNWYITFIDIRIPCSA